MRVLLVEEKIPITDERYLGVTVDYDARTPCCWPVPGAASISKRPRGSTPTAYSGSGCISGSKAFEMYFPEDIVSYRTFRFVSAMEAVTLTFDSLGVYDFNEPGNDDRL